MEVLWFFFASSHAVISVDYRCSLGVLHLAGNLGPKSEGFLSFEYLA